MKEKSKQLQTFILSLMMLIMSAANAWADTTYEYYYNGTTTINTSSYFSGTDFTTSPYNSVASYAITTEAGAVNATKIAKFDSKGSITFTTTGTSTVTVVAVSKDNTSGNNVKLDSTDGNNGPSATYTTWTETFSSVAAGAHTLAKVNKEIGIIYVKVVETGGGGGSTCATPEISCSNTGAVSISCDTDGASIRYTTDDSNPTSSTGTLYESAFNITSTTTVKAIAYKDGYSDSDVASENFTVYTVTFNGNSHGTPASASITRKSDSATISLPGCTANTYYQFQGWSTSNTAADADAGLTAGESYTPAEDITLYAVYKWQLLSQVSPAGAGIVEMRYDDKDGTLITNENNYIAKDQRVWVEATANPGYTFTTWSNGATASTNPISFDESGLSSVSAKTMIANFTANTYTITLDKNSESASAGGSATATYNSNKLTSITAPTYAGKMVEGYYAEAGCTTKIADASGNLAAGTDYTTSGSLWKNDGAVTLYAKWVDAPAADTSLPVTFDFNASPFTPGNITGANNAKCSMTQDNHEIYFRGTSDTEFSIVDDDTNYLHMTQNGSNNHYIAIPISGINGRIDIKVWTTTTDSKFKIRGYLDQGTTTVSLTAPSKPAELAVNAHTKDTKLFDFRMKDISATNGVLYLGVNSSSFQNIEKITIETPAHMLEGPASVTMGDGETTTVSIKNHSAEYLPALGTVPSYVSAALNPSTGELVITPKAIGTGESITLALDTNGDGLADDVDLSILVTVQGVTMGDTPMASAVYAYGADATALSVSASQNDGGTLNYQWYRNTINSTTGGTAISGATESTYTPSTTLAAEDASFYYCVVSSSKSTSAPKTSGVAYVLTSSTGRYFQMSNVAGNKSTSETSIEVTGQKIAGGEVTYYKGTDGKYVLRPDGYGHYYQLSTNAKFEIVLSQAIAVGDKISVKVQGLGGATSRGIWVSASDSRPGSAPASNLVTSPSDTEVTKTYTVQAGDDIVGMTTIYIYGNTNSTDYFTDLIIYTPGDVKISDPTPAEQTVGKGMTPSAISVTASDGTGNFSYQWQYSSNYTNDGNDANDTWNDVTSGTGTGYTTATFTPAASSPTENTTTYYRCIVTDDGTSEPKKTATSGVASVTVEGVTRYYYKISTGEDEDATFDDKGIATFQLSQSNFSSQTSKGYWYINGKNNTVDGDCFDGDALYMKTGNRCTNTEFYVMGASSFTIKCSKVSGEKRTYLVTVDGVEERITESTTETKQFPLNPSGSHIKLSDVSNNVFPGWFTFYQTYTITPTITVKKDGVAVTEATQYTTEGDVDYEVDSDSSGAIDDDDDRITSSKTSVATVSYAGGILTVHPVGVGQTTITIHQKPNGGYGEGRTTLIVNIKKLEVNMAFSFDKLVLTASELVSTSGSIPRAKLPTLTVTHADGSTNEATVNWESDDDNLISVTGEGTPAAPTYSLTYNSSAGQGGARIYAYVNETGNYGAAVAYVDVVVQNGTSNNLPKGETIDVQEQFVLANDNGEEVVTLTYGGYKYNNNQYKYIDFKDGTTQKNGTDSWTNAASFNKYYIDGYQYNSHNENDAYNENGYQLLGMSDDYKSGKCPDGMWYKTSELKPDGTTPYGQYERIRPFALACKGGYLKFEPKKSGVLTAYILQNGVIGRSGDSDLIASKPRLGYWFDEDGWVQTNVTAVAKQPISDGNGIDQHVATGGKDDTCANKNLSAQMDAKWTGDDAAIIPMLKKPYCNEAKTEFYDASGTGRIVNPYYWGDDNHVMDNNKEIIPTRITPVPFHNGFMVPEQCYVKYTLPVIAGKSYYFYGMMTKIGYVGMNFVEDESVLTKNGNNIAHETESTLHLQSDDDMTTYTFNGNVLTQSTLFDEVTLPSNYKPNQWNTICLPFALSENQVEAAFGTGTQLAIYNGLEHSSTEHVYYVKYLRHVDQNILPGQPYLIYPTGTGVAISDDGIIGSVIDGAGTNKRITFNHVLIDKDKLKQAYASYGSNKDVDGSTESFIFTGTYTKIAMPQYSLFYSPVDGKLYRWTGTSTSPNFAAYHAYMHPNSSSVMQNGLVFSFSDDDITDLVDETGEGGQETGIVIVEEIGGGSNAKAQLKSNTKAYNLMGQEIDPRSAKGLVIVNGEKVMY